MRSNLQAGRVRVFMLALTTGCAGVSTLQQCVLSGGAVCAAGGAVLGAAAGSPLIGAVVDGTVGTATGALRQDIKKAAK